MKSYIKLLAVLLATMTFLACKKDETTNTPKANLQGIYEGQWGSGSQAPSNFIKFEFKADGTMKRFDAQGTVIASGSWALNGINFECTYTHSDGQVHKIAGLYTDFEGIIMGTWGWAPSKANGGTVELKKK
jgi:hypothetical protein